MKRSLSLAVMLSVSLSIFSVPGVLAQATDAAVSGTTPPPSSSVPPVMFPVPASSPAETTPSLPSPAETVPPVPILTLDRVLAVAKASGAPARILAGNLAVARAQHAENVARNSFSLGSSLGYTGGVNYGLYSGSSGTPAYNVGSLLNKATGISNVAGLPQTVQGGITASGPLTSASLTASRIFQPDAGNGAAPSDFGVVGLSLSQTVWNGYPGGSAQAVVDKSLLVLKGKELATDSGMSAYLLQVQQAYYAMLSAQRTLAVKRMILEKQAGLAAQLEAVFKLRQASAVDVETARLNAQSAGLDVGSGENDLRSTRTRLANLAGLPKDSAFLVADAGEPQSGLPDLAVAVRTGLDLRQDLRQLELSRKSTTIDAALARGQAQPTVSVLGGADVVSDLRNKVTGETVYAGVKVGLPVVDAGLAASTVAEKDAQDEAYRLQADQLRAQIAADIEDAWNAVRLTLQRLELARLQAKNLEAQFELMKTQNQYGTATTQDMLTASVNAANAETAVETAKINAELAALQLRNAMGY